MVTCRSFDDAQELYLDIREMTRHGDRNYTLHNYVATLPGSSMAPERVVIETDLWSRESLEFYARKNLGLDYSEEAAAAYLSEYRGGDQGDYRAGMVEKIDNVVDCLRTVPVSKRAVITIPWSSEYSSEARWQIVGQNKCMRELHFYIHQELLCCTCIMRVQNADIFPKNIYMVARLLKILGDKLQLGIGAYVHWITSLVHDRSADCC